MKIYVSYLPEISTQTTEKFIKELKKRVGGKFVLTMPTGASTSAARKSALETSLNKCRVALILIGPGWNEALQKKKYRIFSPSWGRTKREERVNFELC